MEDKLKKLVSDYAHDYRDTAVAEAQLGEMFRSFANQVCEIVGSEIKNGIFY